MPDFGGSFGEPVKPVTDVSQKVNDFIGGSKKPSSGGAKGSKTSELSRNLSELKQQSAELGKTGVELELFRLKSLGASEAQLRLAESMLTNIDNFKSAKEVTDSVKTAQDTYNETLAELNALQAAGVISTETYERALSKATQTFAETDAATKSAIESAKRLNDLLDSTPTGQLEKAREEMLGQRGNVLAPLAQGGNRERNDIEPVEQVFPKPPISDLLFQIARC